jgi:tetratricopeptide (TPR) repeat protein
MGGPGSPGGPLRIGPPGRWWDYPEFVKKLGLSDDQQKKMDEIFNSNRLKLIDQFAAVQKEEAIMEPLVSADPPDENKLLAQIDRVAQARAELETLHQLSPGNQQTLYLLADCDLRLGKFKDAIELLEPAYTVHPEDPALQYALGTALIQDGQTQKGAAVIDNILKNGNSALANFLIGASQYNAGDYRAAAAALRRGLDVNPAVPGAWTLYGRALLNIGDNDGAKTAFLRALQADPHDFDACLHLGGMLRHDGENEAATPYLKRALTIRPDSPAARFQVGALDAANGHLDVARTELEALAREWPDFVEAHVQLAMLYSRMNRPHDSERERQIVIELNAKSRSKGPQPQIEP